MESFKKEKIFTLEEEVDKLTLGRLLECGNLDNETKNILRKYYFALKGDKIDISYYYGKNFVTRQNKNEGRLYACKPVGIQGFPKIVRNLLCHEKYFDIDMENCGPNFLHEICKKNDIPCKRLTRYINERETILKTLQKIHKIDRNEAKKIILRIIYLGNYYVQKDGKTIKMDTASEFVTNLKKEIERIVDDLINLNRKNKNRYEALIDVGKPNPKSSFLSLLIQVIENECLLKMKEFFEVNSIKVSVLCFDGLMIRKGGYTKEEINKLLIKCEKFVKRETDYKLKLTIKDMDGTFPFPIPELSSYVNDETEAQERLFDLEGKEKFKYCNGELYVFYDEKGIFRSGERAKKLIIKYLRRHSEYLNLIVKEGKGNSEAKTKNYGKHTQLQRDIISQIEAAAYDEDWLENSEKTSKGYLLFNDGIYDMKNDKFTKGFNPKIVFHSRIKHNFPEYNYENIKYAYKLSFRTLLKEPYQLLVPLAVALSGDNSVKRFYMCPGKPNAGKSFLVEMMENCFGDFVGSFNAESLAYNPKGDSKEESTQNRWALLCRYKRILFSNEVNMKKTLNSNSIKKHSSGRDKIVARTHYKEEESFRPHYTLFCMANDIPKIEPLDEATMNRLTYIEFPYVFVDKQKLGEKDYYKLKDDKLEKKIYSKKFIDGFIHLLLNSYQMYLKKGMPEFDTTIKNKWTQDCQHGEQIIESIRDYYDITGNNKDIVTVSDLKRFRIARKDIFSTISIHRFNEILKDELKLEQSRQSSGLIWRGIKKKNNIDNIDF